MLLMFLSKIFTKNKIRKFSLLELFLSIVIAQSAGFLGSIFTVTGLQSWYGDLIKPFWNPPNWLFAPVWTLLFTLMGIASYIVWRSSQRKEARKALILYLVHLPVNILWSILFFGLQSPFLALIEIIIMWWLILLIIIKFYKINKNASYLLIPYLCWVSFATMLNGAIWLLNR